MGVLQLLNQAPHKLQAAHNTVTILLREIESLGALLNTALDIAPVTLVFVPDASSVRNVSTPPNRIEFTVKLHDTVASSMAEVARMLHARVEDFMFTIDDAEIDGMQIVKQVRGVYDMVQMTVVADINFQLAIADGDTIEVRSREIEYEFEDNMGVSAGARERSMIWE